MYRKFHPKATEYTFFSSAHETFSRADHMLVHKTSLNKFKTEIILSIFSNHNGMRLKINYKKKTGKFTNMWRLNNMVLNSQWLKEKSQKRNQKYIETNENGNATYPNL